MRTFTLPVVTKSSDSQALTLIKPKSHRRFQLAGTRRAENARRIEIDDRDGD